MDTASGLLKLRRRDRWPFSEGFQGKRQQICDAALAADHSARDLIALS
jgi:hypothetical protein